MIKQQDAQKMLDKLKPILRIQDWDITLLIMPEGAYSKEHGEAFKYETDACTEIHTDKVARMFIKDNLDKEEFTKVLIHECVHLVTNDYDSFVRDTLTHIDSRKIAKVFKNEALWEMEILVTRVATILKPLLKL